MKKGKDDKERTELGLSPKRTTSLESTASVSSASTGRFTGKASADNIGDNIITTQYGPHLFNIVAAVVLCPKHKKVCLSKISQSKGLWLPFTPLRTGDGWFDCIVSKLKQVLAVSSGGNTNKTYLAFRPPEMLHILRIQIPKYFDFITRVTFLTQLTHDPKYPTNCCENNKNIIWFPTSEFSDQKMKELWGPEPNVFVEAIMSTQIEKGSYTEYTMREALKFSPRDPPKTYQEELLKSAGFQEKDIIKVFSEFIQHCYPSQYMSFFSFCDYMTKVGLTQTQSNSSSDEISSQLTLYFRSFGYNRVPFLSFHEFLLGLSAIDKNTSHGGHTGELRSGYIFRYYTSTQFDSNQTPYLEFEDLKNMTRDIFKSKSSQVDESKLESEIKSIYQIIGIAYRDRIDEKTFVKSVGNMKLRGTSGLLRSAFSPLAQIRLKPNYDSIQLMQNVMTGIDNKMQKAKGTCLRCREKRYTIAAHTVRLSLDGTIVEPQDNRNQSDLSRMPKSLRKMSDISFLESTNANIILDILRAFADSGAVSGLTTSRSSNKQTESSQSTKWVNKTNRLQLIDKIMKICTDAESLLKKEPRVVKVCSPCYVLGDIHGNFHDLIIYDRMLWKMGPTCVSSNYLFLGDYVDRGEHGLECILYLLSHKLLAPERFWLLRGNHELRPVQQQFTFHKECQEKLGKYGLQVWEALNRVFDLLPICAIIDDSIFCAHGGIPTSALKIEELLKIPSPMSEPEKQSSSAWEMLWNDPISNQEFAECSEMLRQQNGSNAAFNNLLGFLPNTKRGTAYYFSEEAVNKFLSANSLSHIIRAHEAILSGYQFHMGGKVITIFSSSKYCGGLNESACVLVDVEKIRIIQIDTN